MTSFQFIKVLWNHLWFLLWKYFWYVCYHVCLCIPILKIISVIIHINVIEKILLKRQKNMCWKEIKMLFYKISILSWARVKDLITLNQGVTFLGFLAQSCLGFETTMCSLFLMLPNENFCQNTFKDIFHSRESLL